MGSITAQAGRSGPISKASRKSGDRFFDSVQAARFEGERLMTITLFLLLFFDVRGVVLDPSARPVEGAEIACGAETSTTNARGEFSFASAQSCDATIKKSAFPPTPPTTTPVATSITLPLHP